MAAPCFIAWNGATAALTAALAPTTTGTALKTMLQIKPGNKIRIIEWGYFFDATPASAIKVELIDTGAVFATTTGTGGAALAAGDIVKYNDATGSASALATGNSLSSYSGSAVNTSEGSITATRLLSSRMETGTQWSQQFPLGREPEVNAAQCLRLRATAATAVNMICYIIWEE